jgi:hypothetical protein
VNVCCSSDNNTQFRNKIGRASRRRRSRSLLAESVSQFRSEIGRSAELRSVSVPKMGPVDASRRRGCADRTLNHQNGGVPKGISLKGELGKLTLMVYYKDDLIM